MSKEIIRNRILELTPDVKPTSLTTFVNCLYSLYYYTNDKTKDIDMDWFKDHKAVDKSLEHRPLSSQKTIYASLLRILPKEEYYTTKMMTLGKEIKNNLANQDKTEKQEQGWKTMEEIKSLHDNMYNRIKPFLNSKTELKEADFNDVVNFILFCLTTGIYIPPRRSMDWTDFMIRGDIDKEKYNYIDKNEFVFNSYKTGTKNGEQRVPIPKDLKTILNKYIKVNKSNYLIPNLKGEKMSATSIAKRLNRIFGSNTSTSMLRHIYLSNAYKDVPALKGLTELADKMGHDVYTALQYVKK